MTLKFALEAGVASPACFKNHSTRMKTSLHALRWLAILSTGALFPAALAQSVSWDGPADGKWTEGSYWSGDEVPTSDDDVLIEGGPVILDATGESGTLTLGDTASGGLTVESGGTGFSAGNTMVNEGSLLTVTGISSSWSVGANLGITGSDARVEVRDGASLLVDSDEGSSFVDFGGSVLVTDSGSTWTTPSISVYTGSVVFDNHAEVTSDYASLAQFSDNVATATVKNGAVWTTGSLYVGSEDGQGTLNLESGGEVAASLIEVSSAGTINVGTGGTAGVLAADVANGGLVRFNHTDNITYGGSITDLPIVEETFPGAVTKSGSGTLTLTGYNAWSGVTTIEEGTLVARSFGALSAESTVTVNAGAALVIYGNADDDEFFDVEVGALAGAGSVTIGEGSFLIVGGNDADTTFSGTITGTGDYGFEKTGSGKLTITGAVTLDGFIDLCGCSENNRLEIRGAAASVTANGDSIISGGTLSVVDGASLEVGEGMQITGGAVHITSGSSFTTSGLENVGGELKILGAGSVVQAAQVFVASVLDAASLEVGVGATLSITGGPGLDPVLLVGGPDSTVTVNGTISANSMTTVLGGGLLTGSGTVGALEIQMGGAFSPGNSPGTLNAGNTVWGEYGFYLWEINNASDAAEAKGVTYDWLNIAGTLTLASTWDAPFVILVTSLDLDDDPGAVSGFDPEQSYSWILATASGGIEGFDEDIFAIDTTGFSNPHSGVFSISKSGNDLVLNYSAVPEPAEWGALFGVALLALAVGRSRAARRPA